MILVQLTDPLEPDIVIGRRWLTGAAWVNKI